MVPKRIFISGTGEAYNTVPRSLVISRTFHCDKSAVPTEGPKEVAPTEEGAPLCRIQK